MKHEKQQEKDLNEFKLFISPLHFPESHFSRQIVKKKD
jgi:hypothetical protein